MAHELTFTYVLTVTCTKRSGPDKSADRLHREILAAFGEVDGERMRIDDDTDQGATYETSWVPEIASIANGHGDVWEPFRKPVTGSLHSPKRKKRKCHSTTSATVTEPSSRAARRGTPVLVSSLARESTGMERRAGQCRALHRSGPLPEWHGWKGKGGESTAVQWTPILPRLPLHGYRCFRGRRGAF